MVEISPKMQLYFNELDTKLKEAYELANNARAKEYDPEDRVEIPLARDMAERVEGLVSVVAPQIKGSGVSQRIKELELKYGSQNWMISFLIAERQQMKNSANSKTKKRQRK